jgi:hypothetical protein
VGGSLWGDCFLSLVPQAKLKLVIIVYIKYSESHTIKEFKQEKPTHTGVHSAVGVWAK